MLQLAICFCKKETADTLEIFVERYAKEKELEMRVLKFDDLSTMLENEREIDMALINVGENDDKAVSAAKEFSKANPGAPISFIGSVKQFTITGYEINLVDFLTLPAKYFAFSTLLDRMQVRMVKTDVPSVAILTKQGAKRIPVNTITYMEATPHHVIYHLVDGSERVRGNLNDEAKKVTADRFFRLENYLVNLEHVNKVWENDVYVGSACLLLPFSKKARFLNSLLAYMNRG